MSRRLLPLTALLLLGAAAPAGYLAPGSVDILQILPPAPARGEARYRSDRTIFARTRRLRGTPRWTLAENDVKLDPASMLADFSCAAGIALTPADAPLLTAVAVRSAQDTNHQSSLAKRYYRRQRPYQIDSGPTCQPPPELAGSFDYPSGHTTQGWTWAEVLADALPSRATPILARGRAFGQSRIVCGVHNESAVEAGYMTAAATMDAVRSTPAYQHDITAARAELARLAEAGPHPDPARCAAEAAIVAAKLPD